MKNKGNIAAVTELTPETHKEVMANIKKGKVKKTKKEKTDKKFLKRIDGVVRKLDNAISELHDVSVDINHVITDGDTVTTNLCGKDTQRLEEMSEVVEAALSILYFLNRRMARKYTGKDIEDVNRGQGKRKALKM